MAVAIRPSLLAGERSLTLAPAEFVRGVEEVLAQRDAAERTKGTYLYSISVVERGAGARVDEPTYLYGEQLYDAAAGKAPDLLTPFLRRGTTLDVSIYRQGEGTEHTAVRIESQTP
jgi:hypothetical protein